jgi:2-polyprenyl-6-methoxyphenol hydroxylase-like FAD-dependent oxidoreductase
MMNGKSSQTAPTMNGKKDRLRVVIVGGSITGLTLAHALYHSDVDFVLLEARGEIAPQVGASIVILPNGSRILDQLGIFDHVYSMVEPLTMGLTWTKDGKNLVKDDSPVFVGIRFVLLK